MDENTHFLTERELAAKEKKRLQANKRNRKYRMNNKEKEKKRISEHRSRGSNFKHDLNKPIQILKNGKMRYKPAISKYSEELGNIIIHLTLMGHPLALIARAVGINRFTILGWKRKSSEEYIPEFTRRFEIAYENSNEVLFSHIRVIMKDKSGDMYADNKNGNTIMRPNNANVQRDKLILDKLFHMIRTRQRTFKTNSNITVYITQYGTNKNGEPKPAKTINTTAETLPKS